MSKTIVFLVSDEAEIVEKVKIYFNAQGLNVQAFSPTQWREGMDSSYFRNQLRAGVPELSLGSSPLERSNVLPFPGQPQGVGSGQGEGEGSGTVVPMSSASRDGSAGRVATMEELEARAIENAIAQYRGNLTEAAKALGIGRATLYRKVKQYHIDPAFARRRGRAA